MRILLLGEYSNVHATLAKGLKALGHDVTVLSNGDFWKDYPRDINLSRRPGRLGGMAYMAHLAALLPKLRGYDVVQLINPLFLELKAERIEPVYDYLRRYNRHMVMGAFGMDWYWVKTCVENRPLRYSDFNIGDRLRDDEEALRYRRDWLGTEKERLNRGIATDCDAIVAGLYEYWVCYHPVFPQKTTFIPYPIEMPAETPRLWQQGEKIKVFLGINRERSAYKGTDIMLRAAQAVQQRHPERMELRIAESVPFAEYQEMMNGSHMIMDQLYSYTPSMNPLLAMSKGIVCVGGGEPENYEILGERELRPIVNVEPTEESVEAQLERIIAQPELLPRLQTESVEYVRRHHEYMKVAKQYEEIYERLKMKD